MSRGTFQKKLRQRKLNKSTILSVLSGPHVNKSVPKYAIDSKCNKWIT